jgi:hypothetical protein
MAREGSGLRGRVGGTFARLFRLLTNPRGRSEPAPVDAVGEPEERERGQGRSSRAERRREGRRGARRR